MYFSRVRLNPTGMDFSAVVKTLMHSVYQEHKIVWDWFENEKDTKRDFIYRRFDLGCIPQYFLVSERKPIAKNSAWEIETSKYEPVVKSGDAYSFQLRVNPVITRKIENSKNPKSRKRDDIVMDTRAKYKTAGKKMPSNNEIVHEAGVKWIQGKNENYGFEVPQTHLIIEGYTQIRGEKDNGNHSIQLGILDFSGILRVTDPEKFRNTLTHGVGRAKAFGCGLLLIKRI